MRRAAKDLTPAILSVMIIGGCAEDAGQGTLAITAYGEAFIEEGIAAEEVADGWALEYDSFEVTLEKLSIGSVTLAGPVSVDLAKPSNGKGQTLTSGIADADDYSGGAYTVTLVHIKATASKGGVTKALDWTIDVPTHYSDCDAVVSVPKDGTGAFQVTIHADHLLYDSLVAKEPALAFGAFADADKDNDGNITRVELEAAGIGAFDPGDSKVENLWQWIEALAATLGHANGEGHCKAS